MACPPNDLPPDIHGRCHCGNLSYHLYWPAATTLILRACGCDYCSRHGALWISHPAALITLTVAAQDLVLLYRFGTESADFLVCRRCGILTLARCAHASGERAVVNANTFENLSPAQCGRAATDFDNEDLAERLARRLRNWSPLTTVLA